ncbi:hypothetical protein [Actinomadura sp. 7K507]|uniref:hypothetical protein n=1 Tax=Actinomadura sp. 7K507 TaxID=2530365 RepID=UPI00104959B1|nr:hypothetical protein [Actinomadura sp. 7K507]TDC75211.1 hypothetical protein E1285_41755 [Actinomadura sp. 7K507]
MVDVPRAVNGTVGGIDLSGLCPGWCTERIEGRLVARRLGSLTDYQLGHGCMSEVTAGSITELVVVCEAQNTLAERIEVAETVRRGFSGPAS